MKNKNILLQIFPLLFALLSILPHQGLAQQQLIVGTGGNSSQFFGPISGSYAAGINDYSYFVYLYDTADLNNMAAGSTISAISWFLAAPGNLDPGNYLEIRMANTHDTAVAVDSNHIGFAGVGTELVYSSTNYSLNQSSGWVQHQFQQPFTYTGGNLKVCVIFHRSSATMIPLHFRHQQATGKAAGVVVQNQAFGTEFHPRHSNARPNARFTYSDTQCSGAPLAGVIRPSRQPACFPDSIQLDLVGATTGPGISYQWQSSVDSLNWSDISGATRHTLNVHPQNPSYYRCRLTCSGIARFTTGIFISQNAAVVPISGRLEVLAFGSRTPNRFFSLQEVFNYLACTGIDGPVEVHVAPISVLHSFNYVVGAIPGTSATNTVTVFGNNSDFQGNLRFFRANHVTIKDLNISAEFVGFTSGSGILISDSSSHIKLDGIKITPLQTLPVVIRVSGSTNHVTIGNSEINGGGIGVQFFESSTIANNHLIHDCKIVNSENTGIELQGQKGVEIRGNQIYKNSRLRQVIPNVSNGFRAIRVWGECAGGSIHRNRLYSLNTNANEDYPIVYGISLEGVGIGSVSQPFLVYNNMIYNLQGNANVHVFYFSGAHGSRFVRLEHNTVAIHRPEITGSFSILTGFRFENGPYQDIVIRNNLISLRSPSQPVCAYSALFSLPASNFSNNVFDLLPSSYFTFWGASVFASLADWQTAGYDTNSLAGPVDFWNVADGALTPLGTLPNNAGIPVNIFTDIFGQARSVSSPDVGAVEYEPASADIQLELVELRPGNCGGQNDEIAFQIRNVAGPGVNLSQNPIQIHWRIIGPQRQSGVVNISSGNMASGTIRWGTGTISLSHSADYKLVAYIQPSAINTIAGNDTLRSTIPVQSNRFHVYPRITIVPSTQNTIWLHTRGHGVEEAPVFISEICHQRIPALPGSPVGGWPTYINADDFIEISGLPAVDLSGWTLEQYQGSGRISTHTFEAGTVIGPQGTIIVGVGGLNWYSANDPSNAFYLGNGSFYGNFTPAEAVGRVLRNRKGEIVDAVGYQGYVFPTNSGVTTAHWSGSISGATGTSGIRLMGMDNNNASSWQVASTSNPQDPNIFNPDIPAIQVPNHATIQWMRDALMLPQKGTSISMTNFPTWGLYRFVVMDTTVCGVQVDTAYVVVGNYRTFTQVIHAAFDEDIGMVDVWVDNVRYLSRIRYLSETGFIYFPNYPVHVSVTLPDAADTVGALSRQRIHFGGTPRSLMILSGMANQSGFNPGKSLRFRSFVPALLGGASGENNILFYNGVTDMDSIQVAELTQPDPDFVPYIPYGAFHGYQTVLHEDYGFEPKAPGISTSQFGAPLKAWGFNGMSPTIIMHGFRNPQQNNGGPSIALWMATGLGGSLLPLPIWSSIGLIEQVLPKTNWLLYPNPANQVAHIRTVSDMIGLLHVYIFDSSGRVVLEKSVNGSGDDEISLDVSRLSAGQYYVCVVQDGKASVKALVVGR